MAEMHTTKEMPDTSPIDRLVRRTRQWLRSSWVATGLGLSLGLLLATLVAVALLDLAVPLWPTFRLLGLLAIVIPASWAFLAGVVLPLFRRLSPTQVARRIEKQIPSIHNRLVSCIDITAQQRQKSASPAFYRRLVQEALERIRTFRIRSVIDFLSLRRASVFAGVSAAAFFFALAIFSDRLPTAMARIFSPFADIPPASGVVYAVQPGDAKVLRGEEIVFEAMLEKGQTDKLRLELESPHGSEKLGYDLRKEDDGAFRLTLSSENIGAGFENGLVYRVSGGGTWSKQYRIQILDRPVLTGVQTRLHYPEYMGISEPLVGSTQTADVTGPEGSAVEVVVTAEGDVAEGEIQWVKAGMRREETKQIREKVWFADKLPAGAAVEGTWHWDAETHGRPAHTEPAAAGTHQHWFSSASEGLAVQPGESLFAYVFIEPEKKPETIMLQWHDGQDWEHRAFWGKDQINQGKLNSPSRQSMGELPATGRWVRLEVPASAVNLEGKTLHGMTFTLNGGQCFWSRAGTLPARYQMVSEMMPFRNFAMSRLDDTRWSGRFPLEGEGFYRVELRNELGYANKTMKEGKYLAIRDLPPQVIVERPGSDLVLSEPSKVPLVIAAYDDYGLADVTLEVKRDDEPGFARRALKRYDRPVRSDNLVAALDLVPMQLKAGQQVAYRIEARDRKGQKAVTKEYLIRISPDGSAADKQREAFEKSQDNFREKLVKLIAEQAKVKALVEKINAKYAPLNEKLKEARDKAAEQAKATAPDKTPVTPPPPKLDATSEKLLQELRKELGELAKAEQQNEQLGKQMAADLKNAAEQANALSLLPAQVAAQMQELQKLFQQKAVQPLEDLASKMAQAQDSKQAAPDVPDMQAKSDRLQKELEAIQSRLKALAEAEKEMHQDAAAALEKLKEAMLKQDAEMSARDLEALKEYIAKLRKELQDLENKQEGLLDKTEAAGEAEKSELSKEQAKLEKRSEKPLADTKALQASDKMKKMKRKTPKLPGEPYTPDAADEAVPPKEADPDEPESAQEKGKEEAKSADKEAGDKNKAEEDPLFMPALGGPKPKLDPRFADKLRPVKKKPKKNGEGKSEEELADRQAGKLQELSEAEQSLAADEKSLDKLLGQMQQAAQAESSHSGKHEPGEQGEDQGGEHQGGEHQGGEHQGGEHQGGEHQGGEHPGEAGQSEHSLAQTMQSSLMRQALAMAARMQQLAKGKGKQGKGQGESTPSLSPDGNLQGGPRSDSVLVELSKLDPATRAVILKMQPKMCEELLLGMKEEGPDGYQKFIQDYFRRLSQEKK